jgi:hypothetical protein
VKKEQFPRCAHIIVDDFLQALELNSENHKKPTNKKNYSKIILLFNFLNNFQLLNNKTTIFGVFGIISQSKTSLKLLVQFYEFDFFGASKSEKKL